MDIPPPPSDAPPIRYEPPIPASPPTSALTQQPPPPLPTHTVPAPAFSQPRLDPVKQLGLRAIGTLIALVFLHVLWRWLASKGGERGGWPSYGEAWSAFKELRSEGFRGQTLGGHLSATLGRVIFATVVGISAGVGLGALAGSHRIVRNLSDPFVSFMRVLTPTVLLGIAVTFQGIGDTSVRTAATIPIVFFVASSVSRLDMRASGFGRSLIERLVEVVRAAVLLAWIIVTFAELVGSESGLGALTWAARSFLRTEIAAVVLVMSAVCVLAVDYLIRLPLLFIPDHDTASESFVPPAPPTGPVSF